jgi:hypothetical protein
MDHHAAQVSLHRRLERPVHQPALRELLERATERRFATNEQALCGSDFVHFSYLFLDPDRLQDHRHTLMATQQGPNEDRGRSHGNDTMLANGQEATRSFFTKIGRAGPIDRRPFRILKLALSPNNLTSPPQAGLKGRPSRAKGKALEQCGMRTQAPEGRNNLRFARRRSAASQAQTRSSSQSAPPNSRGWPSTNAKGPAYRCPKMRSFAHGPPSDRPLLRRRCQG